jgi:hypothetical protein
MPTRDVTRVDFNILIQKDKMRFGFHGETEQFNTLNIDALGERLSNSALLLRWIGSNEPQLMNIQVARRITIDVRDPSRQGESWEAAVAKGLQRFETSTEVAVVRVSPVRPRSANFPFTVPLRILQVNGTDAEDNVLTPLYKVFSYKALDAYSAALRATAVHWEEWGDAQIPKNWPNVDVLHFDRVPAFPKQEQMSGDATIAGTLGWFVEKIVAWQVRLIVFRVSVSQMKNVREFASAVVARGGPAILVEAFARPEQRHNFYVTLYPRLIHDSPIDLIWRDALTDVRDNQFDASIFVGAGREEQVRPSNIAYGLWQFVRPENERRRRESLNKVFISKVPLWKRYKVKKTLNQGLSAIGSEWETYKFEYSEREGLLPLSDALSDMRLELAGPVSAPALLSGIVRSKTSRWAAKLLTPRFVNCSFSTENPVTGDLVVVDQETGTFQVGSVYHLGIQVGPKSARVITVNETALVEEVFKWTPEMRGVWVEIGVSGIDFEVVGDPVQRVWLPASSAEPTEIVYFAVIPQKTGVNRIRFAVYFRQNVIQSFRVAVIVGASPSDRASVLARALDIPEKDTRDVIYLPLLEFNLTQSIDQLAADPPKSSRALAILANKWDKDAVITVKGAGDFSVHTSKVLPDLVGKLHGELRSISNLEAKVYPFDADNVGTREQLERSLRTLADRGSMLFVQLFSSSIWSKLEKVLDEPDQIIHIAQILREEVIPWSFVYGRRLQPRSGDREDDKLTKIPVCLASLPDKDGNLPVRRCGADPKCILYENNSILPENVVCPLQFWGFKHLIEVPPLQSSEVESGENKSGVRTHIAVNGSVSLIPGVNCTFGSEIAHFKKLAELKTTMPLAPIEKQYTAAGLKKKLASSPVHISYFFCHAAGGAGSFDSQVILEAPGTEKQESILWHEFAQLLKGEKKWDPPALVFLNGCKTSNYSPEALSPFLKSFVDDLGASGLIGTEITVWDTFAAEMAYHFFRNFLNTEAAAISLSTARRILLSKNNPLGLVYTLYASADLQLVS